MANKLNEIEFAYLRFVIFSIENSLLSWSYKGSSTYETNVLDELFIKFRFYDNKSRPSVVDLTFSYVYTDRNHIKNSDRLFLRVEERHENYFQLFRFKYLFERVMNSTEESIAKKKNIDLVFMVNEIERIESSERSWNSPFDYELLKNCYKKLIKI